MFHQWARVSLVTPASTPFPRSSLQRSHSVGQHRLHRGGCGANSGGDGEGVQRQRLPPHAQELQPLLLSTVRGRHTDRLDSYAPYLQVKWAHLTCGAKKKHKTVSWATNQVSILALLFCVSALELSVWVCGFVCLCAWMSVCFQSAYPGVTNEQGVSQLASRTEMGIKRHWYKSGHDEPAGKHTHAHTHTHTR